MLFNTHAHRRVTPGEMPDLLPHKETLRYSATDFTFTPAGIPHVTLADIRCIPGDLTTPSRMVRNLPATADRSLSVETDRLAYVGQKMGQVSLALLINDRDNILRNEALHFYETVGHTMSSFLPHITIARVNWQNSIIENPSLPDSHELMLQLAKYIPSALHLEHARVHVSIRNEQEPRNI